MTKRKPNPRKPRRNARGQFTKPRRRPEDVPTTSEMIDYETRVPPRKRIEPDPAPADGEHVGYETSAPREQTPRNPIPPEDRWTWKVEPGGSGLKIGSVPGADEPAKPCAPLESAPYGPRRDASGAAPMTPLPASFDAESYGCGPANWEPPAPPQPSALRRLWRRLRRRS